MQLVLACSRTYACTKICLLGDDSSTPIEKLFRNDNDDHQLTVLDNEDDEQ